MAPSSGHLLVPKVLKVVRFAIAKTNEAIRSKLPNNLAGKAVAEPVYARNHPTNPLAYLKQARSQNARSYTTQARTFISSATKPQGFRVERAHYPASGIYQSLQRNGISPFASTLRPNLTGGALPRSAGGYSLGGAGKARYFSHTSGCQAQVVNNVSAGIRAFVVGGGQVRYDGVDPVTGEKRFKSVSAMQDKAYQCFDRSSISTRGTSINFKVSPAITAFASSLPQQGENTTATLGTPELLSTLSGDFARSLRSLSQILSDLQRLSALGELPITLNDTPDGPVLSVRFPGCDADLVTRLCDEVGITRGIIKEDEAWNDDKEVRMALLFPFAPAKSNVSSDLNASDYFFRNNPVIDEVKQEQLDWQDERSESDLSLQDRYDDHFSFEHATLRSPTMHPASPSGYESLEDPAAWTPSSRSAYKTQSIAPSASQDFDGVEGIYRFLQVCDEARR